jgi:adenylate cyclase
VKLIGDAALFACDEPAAGIAIGLDLLEALDHDPGLPAGRVSLAAGTVVTLQGDVYGPVVNLAARLLAGAEPGTLVVGDPLDAVAATIDGVAITPLPAQELKGFDEPQPVWAVRRQ